jgi:hypothetical protein
MIICFFFFLCVPASLREHERRGAPPRSAGVRSTLAVHPLQSPWQPLNPDDAVLKFSHRKIFPEENLTD